MRPRCSSVEGRNVVTPTRLISLVCVLGLIGALPMLGRAPENDASQKVTVGPRIWLRDAQPIAGGHAGTARAMQAISSAQPLALAEGDFDADGIEDLVVGYASGGGGILAFHRGNLDAFAPQSEESFQAIARGDFPSPFLPTAVLVEVPVRPDFVAVGSLNGEGYPDVIVAQRGDSTIYLLTNDTKGKFAAARAINVGGPITALAAGDLGPHGIYSKLLVGISDHTGSHLMVYAGTLNGLGGVKVLSLPGPASNINFGHLGDIGQDAIFVAGSRVQILHCSSMQVETLSLPVTAQSIALGSFIWDRNPRLQMAVMDSNGSVHIAVHAEFDPRSYTPAELSSLHRGGRGRFTNPLAYPKTVPVNGWKIVETLSGIAPSSEPAPVLLRTRISDHGADDVMVLNGHTGQMTVIAHPDAAPGSPTFSPAEISYRPYNGSPIAALSMRTNVDGRPGVVAIHQGQVAPSLMMPLPDPTFTVNTTSDGVFPGACAAATANQCTLREAILEANGDTVMVPAGTYTLTLPKVAGDYTGNHGALYVNHSATIVGAGQNLTIIQAGTTAYNQGAPDGVDLVMAVNEDINPITNATASISNLTLQNGHNRGIHSSDGDGGCMEFDTGSSGNATLTLTNVTLQNCDTTQGGGGGLVIFNFTNPGAGFATITNSIIEGNSAVDNPSAGAGGGIAISNQTRMVMSNSQVLNNKATQVTSTSQMGQGGGIINFFPSGNFTGNTQTVIHNSAISGNKAAGFGGGIQNQTNMLIDQGTIISNNIAGTNGTGSIAGQEGGGMYLNTFNTGCPSACAFLTTLSKVTITGNSATANGGGISIGNSGATPAAGPLSMSFSRLAGNTATAGSNLYNNHTAVTATSNWWGTNSPAGTINTNPGTTVFDPFIELTHTGSPAKIRINQSSTLTGSFLQDNHGTPVAVSDLDELLGLPITFDNPVLGTIPQAQPEAIATTGSFAGTATATFNAGTTGGQGHADATVDGFTVTADIVVLQPPAIVKSFSPTTVPTNSPSTLTFSITNPNVVTIDSSLTDTLPAGLVVASTPNVVNNCSGTTTATAGANSISFSNSALAVGSCSISVNVQSATDNTYSNSVTIDSSDAGNGNTSSASLTVINPPSISKTFGASSIPLNSTTSLSFSISNANVNTTLNGVAFTDSLPVGLVVAAPNNLNSSCTGGTANATAASSSVSLSSATLAAGASCNVSINVQGTTAGTKNNSVQVTSTNAGTGNTSNANVIVVGPPTVSKAFGAAAIPLNGSTSLSFTITNPNTTSALSGVTFSDTLPAGLTVASTPNITGTCGSGTITATAGSGSISLSGGALTASPATGSTCTFSANVTGTTAGTKSNTTGTISSAEGGSGTTSNTATLTVVAPPSITKAFNPTSTTVNGVSTLTFTITNPATNTVAETGVAFTDTLPSGLVVATPNGLGGTCGGTSVATAGSGSIALTGGTVATNGTCTVTVSVTSSASGTYNNTSGNVSSTNGGTGNTASASLIVASPPTVSKAFGIASVPLNGSTSLTLTITNPNSNFELTGVAVSDNLQSGLVIAANPNLSNTCGGSVSGATAGSSSFGLIGGTLASGSCAVSLNVTGITAGTKNNTTGAVSSTETGAGATSNTAVLNVVAPPTISKAFGASSIPLSGTTSLTFTIGNPNTTVGLSGISFADNLPSGLQVAVSPGLVNNCGGSVAGAVGGSVGISLSTGTVSAAGSCMVSVNVTGTTVGGKSNTTGAISSTEGGTGATSNTTTLVVIAPPSITKAFGVSNIPVGGTTSLTLTIMNPNPGAALSGVAVTDNFPAGLQVASTSGTSNTCGGTFTATAGTASVDLSGGAVAAGASCSVSVNVTTTTAGSKANTTGNVTSTNGGTGNTGSATLGSGDFSIFAAPATQTIPAGHMAVFTLTLSSNTGFQGVINLSCSGGPPNSTCTVIPSFVTLGSGDEMAKVTVDLAVPKGASKGASTLTFTGASGALTHNTTAKLTVK